MKESPYIQTAKCWSFLSYSLSIAFYPLACLRMKHLYTCLICVWSLLLVAQPAPTPFELSEGTETATHEEAIAFYETLAASFPEAQLKEMGISDVGRPIHVFLLSGRQIFDPVEIKAQQLPFLLINNAIHPGEPCGVDASMMLARDLLTNEALRPLLDQVVIGIVPMYNIGGALNRGCCSRANQQGPVAHGFRGNARNFDLNRDFIKANSRNVRAFYRIFQTYLPELFVDTHTTNGADYQAVITLIQTLPDKLGGHTRQYQTEQLVPDLAQKMEAAKVPMCPYVYSLGRTPDEKGIRSFLDLPRYSTGYAALFQTMGFITEAHMLKSFEARVQGTYAFLKGLIEHGAEHGQEIVAAVAQDRQAVQSQRQFDLAWRLDTTRQDALLFAGYEALTEPSAVTGLNRLRYDQSQPFERDIPFYKHYTPTETITAPVAYLIPQGYEKVASLLQENGVVLTRLLRDTLLEADTYRISDLKTYTSPYEGHYYHNQVSLQTATELIACYAGDYVAYTNQAANPFLVHVLEPAASDSYFRWNYFDGVLMQKEHFSPYLFEEIALEMLEQDPTLKAAFLAKKAAEPDFAQDSYAQLSYLYRHSAYYEPTYLRYPVLRYQGPALPQSILEDEGK